MIFDLDPALFALMGLTVVAGAAIQSATGVGFGLLVAPVFALVDTTLVPVTVLLIGSVTSVLAAWRSRAGIIWGDMVVPMIARVGGILLGVAILWIFLDQRATISMVFGFVILAAVLITIVRWQLRPTPPALAGAGFLSGLMASMTGIGGPPMSIVYSGQAAAEARSMLNAFFSFGTLITVLVLALSGLIQWRHVALAACFLPATFLGLFLAGQLTRFSDRYIRAVLLSTCTLSALVLIVRGL